MFRDRTRGGRRMRRRGGRRVPARGPARRAKLFANGRSQAVRLPKELRTPGIEVLIRQPGTQLVLQPLGAGGLPVGVWTEIDRLTEGVDFPYPAAIAAQGLDPRARR